MHIDRNEKRAALALLAAFCALSGAAALLAGPTVDEAAHLAAGRMHWLRGDFRTNPEHPPLAKLWAAAPALFFSFPSPEAAGYAPGDPYGFAQRIVLEHPRAGAILALGRAQCLLLGALAGFALWRLARRLAGAAGGLAALGLFAFSPAFLAHAPLIATDVPFCLFLLLALFGLLDIRDGRLRRGASWLTIGLGGGAAAKFSMVFFLPLIGGLGGALVLERFVRGQKANAAGTALALAASGAGAIALLWLAYLAPWLWAGRQAPSPLGGWLPAPYWRGLDFAREHLANRPSYLFGETRFSPWPLYYPIAFALKATLPFLALFAASLLAALRSPRRLPAETAAVLAALAYCLAAYEMVDLQIGIRHFLPFWLFAFLLCGMAAGAAAKERRRFWRKSAAGLLALHAAAAVWAFPNYIPYFNAAAWAFGGPVRCLGDSNLDWGQGLPALARWRRAVGSEPLALSYFGTDDPGRHGLEGRMLPGFWYNFAHEPPLSLRETPMRGLFAIGASNLQGLYFESELGFNPYAGFLKQKPIATPGGCVFVYRMDSNETILSAAIGQYRAEVERGGTPAALFGLACALMENGEHARAAALFEQLPAEFERGAEADARMGACALFLGEFDTAARRLAAAARRRPGDPKIRYNLGGALYELGRFGEARQAYSDAERLSPGYLDAREMADRCEARIAAERSGR